MNLNTDFQTTVITTPKPQNTSLNFSNITLTYPYERPSYSSAGFYWSCLRLSCVCHVFLSLWNLSQKWKSKANKPVFAKLEAHSFGDPIVQSPRVYIIRSNVSCYGIYRSLHRYKAIRGPAVILSLILSLFWPWTRYSTMNPIHNPLTWN